eukprot:scaffold48631_cov57-Attheya_sp.AAC.2
MDVATSPTVDLWGTGDTEAEEFRSLMEKVDKTMENEEKVNTDSNGDEAMDSNEESEEEEDGVEEYEEETEEIIEDPKESNKETIKEKVKDKDEQKGNSFFEKAKKQDAKDQGYSQAKERMHERGEEHVETFTKYSTHIKSKFNINAGTTFDVRSSLIKTLNVMKKVVTTMAIVSRTSKIYEKYLELPSGEKSQMKSL